VALGAAIELLHRRAEGIDDRQLAFGIADAGDSPNGSATDDRPFDVASRAMNPNEVQGGECLASEEVDDAEVEGELMGHPDPLLNEVSERMAIRGVDVTSHDDPRAFRRQVVEFEDGSTASLRLIGDRQ
jgi:hypothetical protein